LKRKFFTSLTPPGNPSTGFNRALRAAPKAALLRFGAAMGRQPLLTRLAYSKNVPFHGIYPATGVLTFMQGETGERWRKLCEQAAVEQDPDRLLELAQEITRLLDEKEQRIQKVSGNGHANGSVSAA